MNLEPINSRNISCICGLGLQMGIAVEEEVRHCRSKEGPINVHVTTGRGSVNVTALGAEQFHCAFT